jgi:hypothetical protein
MKNNYLIMAMSLMLVSCARQPMPEEPAEAWNGYFDYLKQGEVVHTLWAGQNINVGTVTYGIDSNANFYVTYQCISGWLISESHMFAGDKAQMPLNKPGSPKVGRFPHSAVHQPRVDMVTYRVPLATLPPAEDPGFVVASHCVVHGPGGQKETAWAEGDYTFSDKGWGWYDIYFFNQSENMYTLLFGTQCGSDSLVLYMVDVTNINSVVIFSERHGIATGPYDGAAYDAESLTLFYCDVSNGSLWATAIADSTPSVLAGTLQGMPMGGAFYDGSYYYVDATFNRINKVLFGEGWTINGIVELAAIPGALIVNDLAFDLSGTSLYILGDTPGGIGELLKWSVADNSFSSVSADFEPGSQLAFGSDNELYIVTGSCSDSLSSVLYTIDLENYVFAPVKDTVLFLEDPFSDLSLGPVF